MDQKADMATLFEEYGRAVHYAQLLEYDLVSIWILDSITKGISLSRKDLLDFQTSWGMKTLGGLFKPFQDSALIPEDMKVFLELVRLDRNKLIHTFFMGEDIHLESSEGIQATLQELLRIKQNLETARNFFHSVLESYSRDFEIDIDKINAEVRAKIEGTEQEDGCGP